MDVWRFEVLVVDTTRIGSRKLRTPGFFPNLPKLGATVLFKEWVSSLLLNTKLGLGREIFTTVGRILFIPSGD